MWARQRVLIYKTDDGIRRMSIETVIENYLLYDCDMFRLNYGS